LNKFSQRRKDADADADADADEDADGDEEIVASSILVCETHQ